MSLEELRKQGDFTPSDQPFIYRTKTLLSGHPDFEFYSAIVTPEHGLCKITAVGKDINVNSFGSALTEKFNDLVGVLSSKYGSPFRKFDFLRAGIERMDDGSCQEGENTFVILEFYRCNKLAGRYTQHKH